MRFSPLSVTILLAASAVGSHAFAPPSSPIFASVSMTPAARLRYVRHEDDMGWLPGLPGMPQQPAAAMEEAERQHPPSPPSEQQRSVMLDYDYDDDYEAKVALRFSRYRRRERLRGAISYGAELDRRRQELDDDKKRAAEARLLEEIEDSRRRLQEYNTAPPVRDYRREPHPPPAHARDLLSNVPIPIVNFRTNSDFPGSMLPPAQWTSVANHPVEFDDAEYLPCARASVMRVLVPLDGNVDVMLDGSEPIVVLNGMEYAVNTVDDVLVPSSARLTAKETEEGERAYWLRAKLRDAIYGQVRYGTALRRMDSPLQVLLPSSSSSSSANESEEWAYVEYVVTSESVAIKEMSWEHIRTQGPQLAEDPIKEVSAMQYLKRWAEREQEEEEERRRRQRKQQRRKEEATSMGKLLRSIGLQNKNILEDEDFSSSRGQQENHHIMMPLDLLSDDENLYSITPFCTGGRLLDVLEGKNRFSEPEARYWMRQILKGLSCLKKAGVAHRDMSPENLMVHEGNLYIIDMGMCLRIPSIADGVGDSFRVDREQLRQWQSQRSLILPQTPCGKWYYLSPEVLLSEKPFDGPTVDLWAAGVILFIMLTGLPPWEEPKMTDMNFKLMSTGYLVTILTERRVGLSADAMDLLQRMFWLDPADRLSLEQVCAHPWMTHEDNLPLSP